MKKLKLTLDDLRVDSFRTVPEDNTLRGTVEANSGCIYTEDAYCTAYFSTCPASGDPSCDACASVAGSCMSCGNTGCVALYTYEESYCVCSNVYSCECAFSEASNCHRC
jgi:hypothetical protein